MAELTYTERRDLEAALQMQDGYVLRFSDRSFQLEVYDSVRVDIYDPRYETGGTSKANRLRTFWRLADDPLVAKLLDDLLKLAREQAAWYADDPRTPELFQRCFAVVERLQAGATVSNADALHTFNPEQQYTILVKELRRVVEQGEFETGVDRLHTFCVGYFRALLTKHGKEYGPKEALHCLCGKYRNVLIAEGTIKSELTSHILKSSIETFSLLNTVRNKESLAHDNPLIDRSETRLVFEHVFTTIRFIRELERD